MSKHIANKPDEIKALKTKINIVKEISFKNEKFGENRQFTTVRVYVCGIHLFDMNPDIYDEWSVIVATCTGSVGIEHHKEGQTSIIWVDEIVNKIRGVA